MCIYETIEPLEPLELSRYLTMICNWFSLNQLPNHLNQLDFQVDQVVQAEHQVVQNVKAKLSCYLPITYNSSGSTGSSGSSVFPASESLEKKNIMKSPSLFLNCLYQRGFTVTLRDGKIMINPASKLLSSDKDFIRDNRADIISYLESPVDYELTQYAVNNLPRFEEGEVLDPGVIITHPDFPVMVLPQSFVDSWEAWNKSVDEKRLKAETPKPQKQTKKKNPTIIQNNDESGSFL